MELFFVSSFSVSFFKELIENIIYHRKLSFSLNPGIPRHLFRMAGRERMDSMQLDSQREDYLVLLQMP